MSFAFDAPGLKIHFSLLALAVLLDLKLAFSVLDLKELPAVQQGDLLIPSSSVFFSFLKTVFSSSNMSMARFFGDLSQLNSKEFIRSISGDDDRNPRGE